MVVKRSSLKPKEVSELVALFDEGFHRYRDLEVQYVCDEAAEYLREVMIKVIAKEPPPPVQLKEPGVDNWLSEEWAHQVCSSFQAASGAEAHSLSASQFLRVPKRIPGEQQKPLANGEESEGGQRGGASYMDEESSGSSEVSETTSDMVQLQDEIDEEEANSKESAEPNSYFSGPSSGVTLIAESYEDEEEGEDNVEEVRIVSEDAYPREDEGGVIGIDQDAMDVEHSLDESSAVGENGFEAQVGGQSESQHHIYLENADCEAIAVSTDAAELASSNPEFLHPESAENVEPDKVDEEPDYQAVMSFKYTMPEEKKE